ncbi:RNA-directed DNA polymerase from mobile element jockey, partial [Trichonephila clavipes]
DPKTLEQSQIEPKILSNTCLLTASGLPCEGVIDENARHFLHIPAQIKRVASNSVYRIYDKLKRLIELNQKFSEAFVEASKPKFKNAPKILSPEFKSKIHQRNRLRKFWQRTRYPSIYSEFRTLSREIAKDIQSHSRTQWEKHIEALSPVDNTLWRKSSLLRKPFRSIPLLKEALGSTAITPIEKAEVIVDSLQEQFEPNHVVGREDLDQRIHAEVENFLATPHVQEIEPTTPMEVLT